MSRTNCFIFAVLLYLRRAKKGDAGYIAMRRSLHGNFPHFLYMHRGRRFISYTPYDTTLKFDTYPPPIFRGFVKWGDERRGPWAWTVAQLRRGVDAVN